ncbi:hypothetical protein PLESTB_000967400 [Pleodorina starrii]|uniref:Protein kinase domain-containing protein n=1 Tax=Pleodorina starrii TaxID=330485 RepID=A0A9W6BNC2_9CHLO|nr:hypothetical protein PLESTB_000967400 [Pleodorina starrii]
MKAVQTSCATALAYIGPGDGPSSTPLTEAMVRPEAQPSNSASQQSLMVTTISMLPAPTFEQRNLILQVVLTYTARGARLTPEFFERAWRAPAPGPGTAPAPPRPASMLPALPSGDGLGNPRKARHERQGWRDVLSRVGAAPDKGLLMLVQEYCDKGSLAAAIKRGFFRITGKNPREQVLTRRMLLRTATEICRGMIHMHKASVVHGDLKPANVLLHSSSSDRRGFVVKVRQEDDVA